MVFRFANRPQVASRHSSSSARNSGSVSTQHASRRRSETIPLCDLPRGQRATIEEIELSAGDSEQLMLFGFMPGVEVMPGPSGPGGDPRVYCLDGTEVAVRRETARHILVHIAGDEERA